MIIDDLWEPFHVGPLPITPIVVNDNLIDLLTTPSSATGRPVTVEWRPQTAAYQVDAQVTTVAAGGMPQIEVTTPAPGRIRVRGNPNPGPSRSCRRSRWTTPRRLLSPRSSRHWSMPG